jgi:hypothetical protein
MLVPWEDAGSVHIRRYGRDCVNRAELVGAQRGPAAQTVLRQTLLAQAEKLPRGAGCNDVFTGLEDDDPDRAFGRRDRGVWPR